MFDIKRLIHRSGLNGTGGDLICRPDRNPLMRETDAMAFNIYIHNLLSILQEERSGESESSRHTDLCFR